MVVDEVKALYALPPGEFVAERTLVVRRLKHEKRAAHAAAIAKLRRPKAAEWLLNRLAREDPAVVERWATSVAGARDAQSAAIGGASGDDFRVATNELNAATRAIADAALGLESDIKRNDVLVVLRTLIAADSTDMLVGGVVGSEGVLEPADLFAGAPEPILRLAINRPPKSARAKGRRPEPPIARKIEPETVSEIETKPEPRPTAGEMRRRTRLIAEYGRAQTSLDAARGAVDAGVAKVDVAKDVLAKAEDVLARRVSELEAAERDLRRLADDVESLTGSSR